MMVTLLQSILNIPVMGMQTLARSTGAPTEQAAAVSFSLGSLLLCVLMLLVLAGCAMAAFKIYMAIRGGKIAQGWLWFVVGFSLLGTAELFMVAAQLRIVPVSLVWIDALRAVAVVVLLIGTGRLRKLLT